MPIEGPVTFISDLNPANPVGSTDKVQTLDDHVRNIKLAVLNTFPSVTGAVNATQADLNKLVGLTLTTANLNDAALLSRADQSFTGLVNRFSNASGGRIALIDLDQAAGHKIFTLTSNAGSLRISPTTDALSVVENAITVSANVASEVTNVALNADLLSLNGPTTLTASGAAFTLKGAAVGNANVAYMQIQDSAGTRQMFFGKDGPASPNITLQNDLASGVIALIAGSVSLTGNVFINGTTTHNGQTTQAAGDLRLNDNIVLRLGGPSNRAHVYHSGTNFFLQNTAGAFLFAQSGADCLQLTTAGDFNFYDGIVTTANVGSAEVGFKGAPQNTLATSYTLALTDCGRMIKITAGGTAVTIPAHASVAIPDGSMIGVHNRTGGSITIAAAAGILIWNNGLDTRGTRTLPNNSVAVLYRSQADEWFISGAGLS